VRVGAVAGLAVLLLGAAMPPSKTPVPAASSASDPMIQILNYERSRSLGKGRLTAFLHDRDAGVAARAALAIGRTRLPQGAAALMEVLRDGGDAVPVRAMAAFGLGLIGRRGDIPELLGALRDPADAVRAMAADALGRIEGEPSASTGDPARIREAATVTAALAASLARDPVAPVRARAAEALASSARFPAARQARRALEAAVNRDPDPAVKARAAWALFRGYAASAPVAVFLHELHSPDEQVRLFGIHALERRANPKLPPTIRRDPHLAAAFRYARADSSWRVRWEAWQGERLLAGHRLVEGVDHLPAWLRLRPLDRRAPASPPGRGVARPAEPTPAPTLPPAASVAAIADARFDASSAAALEGPGPGPHPVVRFVTTEGDFDVELFPEWAPTSVASFLSLVARGFYDHLRFFRVIPDFVIQGGDPTNKGDGDAGYSVPAEENPLTQGTGVISLGLNYDDRTERPIRDSGGSQFYVTESPQYHLDGDFTVFGRVIRGQNVVDHIAQDDRMLRVERLR